MKVVLPGRPESQLQALATGLWDSRRVIAYITGNCFSILGDPDILIQTVYDDDEDPLEAIALDEGSGKIAVCTSRAVRIYKPFGQEHDALKWALESSFAVERDETRYVCGLTAISLSWGSSEELLVAHSALDLYKTAPKPECLWHKQLPNAVRLASISYDSALIATVGQCDRLVKVWRRLSYGSDDVRFDFRYLPHPNLITGLRWRRPAHVDQTIDNVLYTFCADNLLRIWTGSDSYGHQLPQLWGKLDLGEAIQDKEEARSPRRRLAFIMDGRDLSAAAETAVLKSPKAKKVRAGPDLSPLDHVVSVANKSPEVCIVWNGRGHMSVWAFENVGPKTPKSNIYSIAHVTSTDLNFLGGFPASSVPHVEASIYCNRAGRPHILLHLFNGQIKVYESDIVRLLSHDPNAQHVIQRHLWTGHSAPVRKIVRSFTGCAIVSRTAKGQCVVWKHGLDAKRVTLSPQATIQHSGPIHRMCVIRQGRFVVFLQHESLSLWDCQETVPLRLDEVGYSTSGKPLCLLILPRPDAQDSTIAHIATVTSEKKGIVWEVRLPHSAPSENTSAPNVNGGSKENGHPRASIQEFAEFELEDAGDLAYVLPVDPAGSTPVVSGFLDVFARDVAVSYTHSGRMEFWTARVNRQNKTVEWLSTSSMETGVRNPSLASGSTMKTAALVDSTRSALTIWDIRGARLEHTLDNKSQDTIQDLDWTSTPDSQSILAVGFLYRVLLLSQMRYDYLNKGPAWAAIREISIRDLTPHPIGDSTWLGGGYLVIGAGNQFIVHDREFDVSRSLVTELRLPPRKDGRWDLFEVVQRLNGPLPVFHPQFLSQCILAGKTNLVHRILSSLHKTLKFWVEGETIDDYLGLPLEDFYTQDKPTIPKSALTRAADYFSRQVSYEDDDEPFDEDVATAMNERLTQVAIAQLTSHEQIQLVDIIECVGFVEKQRRSLDENGARFMLFCRQHALRKGRTSEISMSWREICWAYHSGSQDILLDFISRQHHGTLRWEDARESGMFAWMTDETALKHQFEVIARNEYTKGDLKNPVDCSLFYLALKKKTVLQGLWRMASWNREQGATVRLLANNFKIPAYRTKALKNAYALLSKRRFGYAAAWFLLADHLSDAVRVCLDQLKDLQLAIAVARVYEGDQGPVLRRLLEEEVLAIAAREGNRWLASWAFWMLRRRDKAVCALISPVYTLLDTAAPAIHQPQSQQQQQLDLTSKLFLADDPALVILYSQLRQKTLQTLRGASKVTPRVEREFVLHSARLYDRMGCDLLGLDIVRNWEFLRQPGGGASAGGTNNDGGTTDAHGGNGGVGFGIDTVDPLTMLRRRRSLVVATAVAAAVAPAEVRGQQAAGGQQQQQKQQKQQKHKQPPTVFEEPDANSLLDSFGF